MKTGPARLTCNLSWARQSSRKLLTSTSIRLNILQTQFRHTRVSVQEDCSGARSWRGHSPRALHLPNAPLPAQGTGSITPPRSPGKLALVVLMPAADTLGPLAPPWHGAAAVMQGHCSNKLQSSPHAIYISLQNSGAVPSSQSTPLPPPTRSQDFARRRDSEVGGRSHVLTGDRQT